MRRWLVAGLACAVTALAAAPARADLVDDDPAVAAQGSGDMRVFIRGRDNALWTRSWTGSSWSGWSSLGGSLTSGPAAMARPGGIYDVFVRGPDNAIHHRSFTPATGWSGWDSLGGTFTSGPGAMYRQGGGQVDVFGVGLNHELFHNSWNGQWSGWILLGCCVSGAPSAESPGPDTLDVWVRGTDSQLYQKYWTPTGGWSGFVPLGGSLTSTPEGTAWAGDRRDVFVRGPGSVIYDRVWTASTGWGTFQRMPGVVGSAPAATALAPGVLQLFARASIGLVSNTYNGAWSGWQNFSEIPPAPPAPTPAPAPATPSPSELRLRAGFGCIPVGGRVPVRIRVYQRNRRLKPRIIKVKFFIDRGKRHRWDRHPPWKTRMRVAYKPGSRHRISARIFFRRKGQQRIKRKTISKHFTMCR